MRKSLNTIIPEPNTEIKDEAEKIQNIPLNEIEPHPGNRKVGGCDKKKLKDMATSIKATGVLQPIIIRRKPGFKPGDKIIYQIVAGERRWRASGLAKQKTIPAIIREISDDQLMEIQFIENIQREDVHPLDESENYVRMIQTGRYNVKQIADRVGKSTGYVTQRMQLSKLTDNCKQAYIDDKIQFTYAFELSRLQAEEQEETLKFIIQNKTWVTLQEIKNHITRTFLELTDAPFPLDSDFDDSGIPACDGCQERTGINRDLFSDLKKDQCTNSLCYKNKVDTFLKNLLKEFPNLPRLSEDDIGMQRWLEWKTAWDDPDYKPFRNEIIPDKKDYQECVIVESYRNRKGKIILAKKNANTQEHPEPGVCEQSSDTGNSADFYREQTINMKAYAVTRKAIFSKMLAKLNNINMKTIQQLPPTLIAYIQKNKPLLEMTFEHFKCIKPEDFRLAIVGVTTVEELLQFCLSLLIETVIPVDYQKFPDSPFHEMAAKLKIDIEKIQTDARKKATEEYDRKHKTEDEDSDDDEEDKEE